MSILKARNRQPIISFGLGVTEATISVGSGVVLVYLNTIYNFDFYTLSITEPSGVNGEQINNTTFELTADVVGTYEIQMIVTSIGTSTELKSNRLKLIVI